MRNVIINFSGHALSPEATSLLSQRYDVVISANPIEFDFSGEVESQLAEALISFGEMLDGSRAITIIPPGQATLAVLLVGFIHGMIGHFPKLCYLEVSQAGVYLPKVEYEIPVQGIRAAGRQFRSQLLRNRSS